MGDKDLKEKQRAWAIAWQDHGDEKALALLCQSMEGLVMKRAGKLSRGSTNRFEELVSEFRLAVVESANRFDRTRALGFSGLCYLAMQGRAYAPIQHEVCPASLPDRVIKAAARVAIAGDDHVEVANLIAPAPYVERDLSKIFEAAEEAGLDHRERRVFERYKTGETREQLGRALGVSETRIQQLDYRGLKKIRRVLAERGLGAEDFL